jgi:hypothetical protein
MAGVVPRPNLDRTGRRSSASREIGPKRPVAFGLIPAEMGGTGRKGEPQVGPPPPAKSCNRLNRASARLDRTQEVGGSSPASSSRKTLEVEHFVIDGIDHAAGLAALVNFGSTSAPPRSFGEVRAIPGKEDCDGIERPRPPSGRVRHLPPAAQQVRGLLAPRRPAALPHGRLRPRRARRARLALIAATHRTSRAGSRRECARPASRRGHVRDQ